jgi:hypothetical protein
VLKLLFVPFSVIGGVLAGFTGKRLFGWLWHAAAGEPAPEPDQRGVSWPKLAAALVLQGAIFRAVRGLVDRGSRELFSRATGRWPGEESAASGQSPDA